MVLTDDPNLAERVRSLRNLCFQRQRRFYHEELGFNFRLTNLQAAIGLAQLERMDQIIAHKRWIGQEYTHMLKDLKELQLPIEEPWAHSVYWMYGIILSEEIGMNATQFAKKLAEKGVETRPFFLGMHEQPVFSHKRLFLNEHYPVAEQAARQGLYLPSGLSLDKNQLQQICNVVHEVFS